MSEVCVFAVRAVCVCAECGHVAKHATGRFVRTRYERASESKASERRGAVGRARSLACGFGHWECRPGFCVCAGCVGDALFGGGRRTSMAERGGQRVRAGEYIPSHLDGSAANTCSSSHRTCARACTRCRQANAAARRAHTQQRGAASSAAPRTAIIYHYERTDRRRRLPDTLRSRMLAIRRLRGRGMGVSQPL